MRTFRIMAAAMCVAWAGVAMAQVPAAVRPPGSSILKQIPAGSMGFAVVNDVSATSTGVDRFLTQIGLGDMVKAQAPDGVLELFKTAAKLGDGFNPKGGMGIVMLDWQLFNIELKSVMENQEDKLPFVILLPGKGVKELLGDTHEITKGETDKYFTVELSMGPMAATASNGYVMLSPMEKALDVMLEARKKADAEVPAKDQAMIRTADMAIHVNMKVAGPLVDQLMKNLQEQQQQQHGGMGMPSWITGLNAMSSKQQREALSQLQSMTLTARLVKTGVVTDNLFTFVKGSELAMLNAAKPVLGKSLLDRLPTMKYAMAFEGTVGKAQVQKQEEMIEVLMKDATAAKRERVKNMLKESSDQTVSMQFALGAPPDGKGSIGLVIVAQVKDSMKARALNAEAAQMAIEALTPATASAPADDGEAGDADDDSTEEPFAGSKPPVKLTFQKDGETVGSMKVDVITLAIPGLPEVITDKIKEALGDNEIRMLIATPDDKTVVMTLGGSTELMAAALKTATKGGGKIGANLAEALPYLPVKRDALVIVNIANIFGIIKNLMPMGEMPLLENQMPIVIGGGPEGDSYRMSGYVSNETIKELVGEAIRASGGGQEEDAPAEGEAPSDF